MGSFMCLKNKCLLNTNQALIISIGQSTINLPHLFPVNLIIYFSYRKKGQNKKLQETYIKLKIEGKEVISGVYSKAAENEVRIGKQNLNCVL